MQKWEYCAIIGMGVQGRDLHTNYPAIIYFTSKGRRIAEIKGHGQEEQLAIAVAELGEQGWEMVGAHGMIFFKRPIP
jgi:hypothetical protein